jgi:hypothetical protein
MRTEAMPDDSSVSVQDLALPKGGGAIVGLGESLDPTGSSGMARFSLPFAVSAGRGYAPALTLDYSSGMGNGAFGLGWNLGVACVQRRTNRGVPRYDGGVEDEYVGPDGAVLVSERDENGDPITTTVTQYGDKNLGGSYKVTRYYPRVEGSFHRIERWQGASAVDDFWLIHDAAGPLHCLGKTAGARLAHPDHPERIAEWRVEESVNPLGEHIYYRYVAENTDGVTADNEKDRDHAANRYLAEAYYGNRTPATDLYLWDMADASGQGWLFSVVLDYGERGVDAGKAPPYAVPADSKWPLRADSFSLYQYGFEVRTHRLCRQILMFHHFPAELKEDHTLVRRLLLTYRESAVTSQIDQARTLAYETDGTVQSLPPVELGYSTFEPTQLAACYQQFDGIAELNDATHYQMVDLYGDGVPGVLFRQGTGWRYRSPVRGKAGTDQVAYGGWQVLPAVPAMQPTRLALMDFDGDGRLDWLVTQPGMAGCFSLKEGNQWSGFTPFSALPPEFFHPQAQLADLVGAGLSDLALIGPKSVRLYANQRDGFMPATDVAHEEGDLGLPIVGRSERELVAFSDVLGSGQVHLIRLRYDGLTCWPNLGRGCFGKPFQVGPLGFDRATFNPDQVFLADLDGSGAADLIYIEQNQLTLFLSQSGNGFAAPIKLALPPGLTFDRLCRVSFADLQGLGVASLVISHRHMAPCHWRLDFVNAKPYLMTSINNNMGAATGLCYRSSVQYWLDDKQANPGLASALPMPIHTLAQVTTRDEITGNSLTRQYSFHHGVYDGIEREFRGFGRVSAQDTQQVAAPAGTDLPLAPPRLTTTWYHTGREADEIALSGTPYHDENAVVVKPTRLTRYDSQRNQDVDLDDVDASTRFWLFRALKGLALRREEYGLDGADNQDVPYTVSTLRHQVRLVQPAADHASPVTLPGALEQVDYSYERIAVDPVVSQHIQLGRDLYGSVTWQVGVNYPRRPKPAQNPYPASLPATSWASSYDDQQDSLILAESRAQPIHLDSAQAWRLDLPDQQRDNVLVYDGGQVPSGGASFEALTQTGGLLDAAKPRTYAGQQCVVYTATPAPFTALVDHVETAEFDDAALAAFDGALDDTARDALLAQAGYELADRVLPPGQDAEPQVWVARRRYTAYQPASGFYRPSGQRTSLLTGLVTYGYDDYACALTKTTDALGNQTTAQYDYRFLQPVRIVDLNANTHEVLLDALGRVVASSFYGTEEGAAVGFPSVGTFSPRGLTVAQAIQDAGTTVQQMATIQLENAFSWMGQITQTALEAVTDADAAPLLWRVLQASGFITFDGWIMAAGRAWAAGTEVLPGIPEQVRPVMQAAEDDRMPVQSATLVADRYPSDSAQQVRISVAYFDGLGRALQVDRKVPAGMAWRRDPEGEIFVDGDGHPIPAYTSSRWAVSGRVEYDNKGQAVRSYQPYYVDDWGYVVDKAMRTCGYADTNFYDAVGRVVKVITAKGYLRRSGFFPWFTVAEDENDTLAPVVKTVQLQVVDPYGTAPADGKSPAKVEATVLDDDGNAVSDVLVTFQPDDPATPHPASQYTDSKGQAQVDITCWKPEPNINVTATAAGVPSAPVAVHFTAVPPTVAGVALSVDPQDAPADGSSAVTGTATVTMSDTTLAPDGTEVVFAASNDATLTPAQGKTVKGRLQTQVTSKTVGDSAVTATAGGVQSAPVTVNFSASTSTPTTVDSIQMLPPNLLGNAAADGAATIEVTAIVTGTDKKPIVDGTTVMFTEDDLADASALTIDTPEVQTSNGSAKTTVRCTEIGWRVIQAAAGEKTATTTVYFGCNVAVIVLSVNPDYQYTARNGGTDVVWAQVYTDLAKRCPAPKGVPIHLAEVLGNTLSIATYDGGPAETNDLGIVAWKVQCGNPGGVQVSAYADNGVHTETTVNFEP